ncbi:hypothetical protein CA54_35890 [Symmachiella macrocystis]|uniref:Sulfatase n=1 Tax=Symmachiella macrocystis TaxID=2527985 RepID=A0A5C6BR89_9PLAN|nr:DUF1501 domain-containing protein [Symmachiella macrocystis]TWU14720.1 hypothetical protein CA54_35890 [Symmachiella macrocystis]
MLHRRDAMIRLGQAGLGGLALPGLLQAEQASAAETATGGKAKSCILLYLWGGPPQQDMFDLKPQAPAGIRSLFDPVETVVPGIQLSDQLPLMAKHTDKMAVVRSYTHHSNIHEVGVYYSLTGKINDTLAVPRNQRNRNDFPNVASVVSKFAPPNVMPGSVTIPRPIGHDGVTYTGTYSGFLGPRYDPMELKTPGEVTGPAPHSIELPDGLTTTRLQARFGLLNLLEQEDRMMQKHGHKLASDKFGIGHYRQQAFGMLTSPEAHGAFDITKEPDTMRDRYGRNEYGESFLLARRLVEAGVRLVTVVWVYIAPDGNVLNVWDNHGGTGSLGKISGYAMLKEKYCLPPLDLAYSALLDDLDQRGLLDETLVVALGEFGRTPKINKDMGRDHWGACQSVLLAGGGIRGGQIYGETDKQAAYVTKDPVKPEDMIATMYHALGIPNDGLIHDTQKRPHRITDGEPLVGLFG